MDRDRSEFALIVVLILVMAALIPYFRMSEHDGNIEEMLVGALVGALGILLGRYGKRRE